MNEDPPCNRCVDAGHEQEASRRESLDIFLCVPDAERRAGHVWVRVWRSYLGPFENKFFARPFRFIQMIRAFGS